MSYHGRQQYDSRRWHIRGGGQPRTTVGNTDYQIKAWDKIVSLETALTTSRTWTLPAAKSLPPGGRIILTDWTGSLTRLTNIDVAPSGSDTLNRFVLSIALTSPFILTSVISDGVSNWNMDGWASGLYTGDVFLDGDLSVWGDFQANNAFLGDVDLLGLTVNDNLLVWGSSTFDGSILGANLRDSTTFFYDNADPTKQLAFQLNGISTGTIRILIAPNRSGVIVTEDLIQQSSPSAPMGYATGAGGGVTQITSKATAVTLNAPCGSVTTNNAALGAGASVSFTVNNSTVSAGDVVVLNPRNPSYRVEIEDIATGSFVIRLTNITAGSLAQAVVINFAVINVASS